jgi:hypothetical protein
MGCACVVYGRKRAGPAGSAALKPLAPASRLRHSEAGHWSLTCARSDAFADNHASLRVSAKLGYRPDGSDTIVRRGARAEDVRLVLDAADLVRPDWALRADGVEGCRGLLGAG